MKNNRKIIIITKAFPPNGLVGSMRIASFVKVLKASDWHVSIVTSDYLECDHYDTSLMEWIKGVYVYKIHVCKNRNGSIGRMLELVNGIKWFVKAFQACVRIQRKDNAGLLLATGGPFSSFVVAYLVSLFTGIRYVLDYRDPWTIPKPTLLTFRSKIYYIGSRFIERWILRRSTKVVVASPKAKDTIVENINFNKCRIQVVLNGYNFDTPDTHNRTLDQENLSILYTGKINQFTPINELLKVIQILKEKYKDTYLRIEFHLLGEVVFHYKNLLKKVSKIKFFDMVTYKESITRQRNADILLSMSTKPVVIPTKIYEYMTMQKPIIVIADKFTGEYDFFQDIKGIHIFDCSDPGRIAEGIDRIVSDLIRGNVELVDKATAREYSRTIRGEEMEKILLDS